MEKNIEFYRECLKRELTKPLHETDFMYMRNLENKINDLKNKYNYEQDIYRKFKIYGIHR